MIIFIPKYGVIAAAYIYLILHLGYFVISISLMHKKILPNEKLKWYLWDVLAPMFTVSIGVYIMHSALDLSDSKIENLVCIGISFIIALLISFLTPPELRRETIKQIYKLKKLSVYAKFR